MRWLLLLLFFASPLQGAIVDRAKHACNQKIMREVIGDNRSPDAISRSLVSIGEAAVAKGFDVDAYDVNKRGEYLTFCMEPIWEGKTIPLTLFVYIWPEEEEALSMAPNNRAYCSNIHSHPIPCAHTVLRGSIDEVSYCALDGHAKQIGVERRYPGMLSYDDQSDPFIHRMVSRAKGKPTVTLHAYGAKSAKEVMEIFHSTYNECAYQCISQRPVSGSS